MSEKKTKTKRKEKDLKIVNESLEPKEEKEDEIKEEELGILISEEEMLKYRLITTQHKLVLTEIKYIDKSVEHLITRKNLIQNELKDVKETFDEFTGELSQKYSINYSDYIINADSNKLEKKQ